MKSQFLSISKIFMSGAVIGLTSGIAVMYLMNGILGHAGMKEAILAFLSFEVVAMFTLLLVFKRLQNVWNISVMYPIPKPLVKEGIL